MQTIGRTTNGNHLVEVNGPEYQALLDLVTVLGAWDCHEPQNFDIDLSSAFAAIRAFALYKQQVDQLRCLTEQLAQALMRRMHNCDAATPGQAVPTSRLP